MNRSGIIFFFFVLIRYFLIIIRDPLYLLGIALLFFMHWLKIWAGPPEDIRVVIASLDMGSKLAVISNYLVLSLFFLLLFGLIFMNRLSSIKKLKVYYLPISRAHSSSIALSLFNFILLLFPHTLLFTWFLSTLHLPPKVYILLTAYLFLFGFSIASWHSILLTLAASISTVLMSFFIGLVITKSLNLMAVLSVYASLIALIKVFSILIAKIPKIIVIERLGYASFSPYLLFVTALLFSFIGIAKLMVGERVVLSVDLLSVSGSIRHPGLDAETLLAMIVASLFASSTAYVVPPLLNLANRYIDSHMYYVRFFVKTRLVVRVLNVFSAFLFGWCYALALYGILNALGLIELMGAPVFLLTTGLLAGMFTLNRVEKDFEFAKCFILYLLASIVLHPVVSNELMQHFHIVAAIVYTVLVVVASILLYDLPIKVACFIRFQVIPWLRR